MYECDSCRSDLSYTCRLSCAVCPEFDLCPPCFVQQYSNSTRGQSSGQSSGRGRTKQTAAKPQTNKSAVEPSSSSSAYSSSSHDPLTHGYRVADSPRFPLFNSDWTAEDEMRLLIAIQISGLGNWVDVAEHVATKTAAQCSKHYLEDWSGRYGHILPPTILVDGSPVPTESVVSEDADKELYFNAPIPEAPGNGKNGDPVESREEKIKMEVQLTKQQAAATTPEELERVREAAREAGITLPPTQEELANAPGSELAGYMVRRGDFDVEWDNDAEQSIADMEFSERDTPADRDLKLAVLGIYNRRLTERQKRKVFAISRNLLDYRAIQSKTLDLPPEQRELVQRMRIFERFSTPEEHERLVEGLLKAKELRRDIERLQMYRLMGIETLEQAEEYEKEKSRRAEAGAATGTSDEAVGSKKRAREEDGDGGAAAEVAATPAPPPGEGLEFLSRPEAELCVKLSITAAQYLTVKDAILSAMVSKGTVEKTTRSMLAFVDVTVAGETETEKVLEFIQKAGWAQTKVEGAAQ